MTWHSHSSFLPNVLKKDLPYGKIIETPVLGTAAQDAARVSNSNYWDRAPDRRSNIPRHLRF